MTSRNVCIFAIVVLCLFAGHEALAQTWEGELIAKDGDATVWNPSVRVEKDGGSAMVRFEGRKPYRSPIEVSGSFLVLRIGGAERRFEMQADGSFLAEYDATFKGRERKYRVILRAD